MYLSVDNHILKQSVFYLLFIYWYLLFIYCKNLLVPNGKLFLELKQHPHESTSICISTESVFNFFLSNDVEFYDIKYTIYNTYTYTNSVYLYIIHTYI